MNNYYYIIAGLPDLSKYWVRGEKDADAILDEIKEQCSVRDRAVIGFLEKGYVDEELTPEFYAEASASRNRFIRKWFQFDLAVRNAKVKYLNNALGRDSGKDVISLKDDEGIAREGTWEFEEEGKLELILEGKDILAREKGIDDLYWAKADELAVFHYFDLTVILSFIVKLKLIDRWMKLDEATGREMFRELVDEVRGTFKGVEYAG